MTALAAFFLPADRQHVRTAIRRRVVEVRARGLAGRKPDRVRTGTGTLPATVLNTWQASRKSSGLINVSCLPMRASASPIPASAMLSAWRMRWSLPAMRAVEAGPGHEHQPQQRHHQQDQHGDDQRDPALVVVFQTHVHSGSHVSG
jgi:hypothetical protein